VAEVNHKIFVEITSYIVGMQRINSHEYFMISNFEGSPAPTSVNLMMCHAVVEKDPLDMAPCPPEKH
jgi:hypothetical protein